MNKELLQKLGIEVPEELTDEEADKLIEDKFNEKETHIQTLEAEKETLSKEKEELSTTVEGKNSSIENLTKELSETKTKLSNTEGRLNQVTEMYKEQFTRPADDKPKEEPKVDVFDILDAIRGSN